MKKIVILMISVLILAIIFFAGYRLILNKPEYLKMNLPYENDDDILLGIIYIGGLEQDYDYSVVDKYFNTRDFETIALDGEEKYLVIPKNCEAEVYSLSMDEVDEDYTIKEKYIKTMSTPFYITCNVSDIISNSLIRVTKAGKQYSYSPYISLKDGSLALEDFVLEIQ